ncbi:MAG: FeoB-associated Cys-rich membrane protein [Clostridiales bacterium]|nr:FeoB-associated Cys-rich membrane protein [Clostridiales bacterium]
MNFPSFVVLAMLIAAVVLIIINLIKNRGKGCGGNCVNCGAACHSLPPKDKEKNKADKEPNPV